MRHCTQSIINTHKYKILSYVPIYILSYEYCLFMYIIEVVISLENNFTTRDEKMRLAGIVVSNTRAFLTNEKNLVKKGLKI